MNRDEFCPPLKQALRFRNALLDLFNEKNIKPPGIGLALCLPDTPFTEQPTQADLEGGVVGENDLPYLSDILPDLMAKIPDFGKPRSGWIKAVHTMWCESWVPQMNLLTRTPVATSCATASFVLKAWKGRPLLSLTCVMSRINTVSA